MSRTDVMGLGPFLKGLGERLDGMTKEDVCRVLVRCGKTVPAVERRGFIRRVPHLARAIELTVNPDWIPPLDRPFKVR